MKRTNIRNLKISSQKIHVTTNNVSLINILTSSGISMLLETGWWPETEILADEVRPGLMRHVEIFHGRKNTTAVPPPLLRFHFQAGDRPRSLDTKAADPRNVSRKKPVPLFGMFPGRDSMMMLFNSMLVRWYNKGEEQKNERLERDDSYIFFTLSVLRPMF